MLKLCMRLSLPKTIFDQMPQVVGIIIISRVVKNTFAFFYKLIVNFTWCIIILSDH